MRTIDATRVAFPVEAQELRLLTDGSWLARTFGRVVVLARDMRTKMATFTGHHCEVAPGARQAVLARDGEIVAVDHADTPMWAVPCPRWAPRLGAAGASGSLGFSVDGAWVWAVVPGTHPEAQDELWVLDAETGRVAGHVTLGLRTTGSHLINHPGGTHVGIDLAVPYGGAIAWARWKGDELSVDVRDSPASYLADVHPDGRRFLTAPGGEDGDRLALHHFGDAEVLASRPVEQVYDTGEYFGDVAAGFVDVDHVLVAVDGGPTTLLAVESLATIAGPEDWSGGHGTSPRVLGGGYWTTDDVTGHLELWRLHR